MTARRRWWSTNRWALAIRRRVTAGVGPQARTRVLPPPVPEPRPRQVFVGGTGRSGTTIVGRLLGAHPAYRMIPVEIKFHSAADGLCDLVDGRTSFRHFRKLMLTRWFDHTVADGSQRGVAQLVSREQVEGALDVLREELEVDRWHAAAGFVHRLMDPIAVAAGASGWVEMTPTNMVKADSLVRIFPDAKLVHVVRDGRDVACSVVSLFWGPNDLDEALDWWARRLELGLAASERLPADRVMLVRMEELIAGDREREYARLLAFLGIDDDPLMRRYFDTSVIPDRAHIGRWTAQVPPERRDAFEAHHAALVEGMRSRGRLVETLQPAGTEASAGR